MRNEYFPIWMPPSSVGGMSDVVICEPLRTPVGRFGGALASLSAADLASTVLHRAGAADRSPRGRRRRRRARPVLPQRRVAGDRPGRRARRGPRHRRARHAARPPLRLRPAGGAVRRRAGRDRRRRASSSPAASSRCATSSTTRSGLRTGVRGGGVELMDRLARGRETAGGRDHPVPGGMLETAENLRREYGIPREEQDELAVRSQQRAVAAQDAGRFADELVPVTVPGRRGKPDVVVDRDEHPRADTTLEEPRRAAAGPARARPRGHRHRRQRQRPERRRRHVRRHHPRRGRPARPAAAARAAVVGGRRRGPEVMGIGPVPATAAALDRAGLTLDEMDVIELNEAFAAQVLAVPARVEARRRPTSGSTPTAPASRSATRSAPPAPASSPPWPTRCTAARRRYGLETMCIGGGQGLAAVFEAVR